MFSIDYILKSITAEALAAAINKYKNISSSLAASNYSLLSDQVKENFSSRYKNHFLVKVGNRFNINFTLEKLVPLLNPHHFFRINRKMIIHAKAVDQVKPYFNNRLKLILKADA